MSNTSILNTPGSRRHKPNICIICCIFSSFSASNNRYCFSNVVHFACNAFHCFPSKFLYYIHFVRDTLPHWLYFLHRQFYSLFVLHSSTVFVVSCDLFAMFGALHPIPDALSPFYSLFVLHSSIAFVVSFQDYPSF
eukprot:470804_1